MRHALALLDFDDESIGDLKRLLLRAAFSPAFLRCREGRRYLAYLFTLEVCALSGKHGTKKFSQHLQPSPVNPLCGQRQKDGQFCLCCCSLKW